MVYLSLVFKFFDHAIKLVDAEGLLENPHLFNEVDLRASPPEHLILILIVVNFEDVLGCVVGDTGVQEERVRDVPEVGDGDPELEVLDLLLIGLVLNLDAATVTYEVELLLLELVDLLEGHQLVLFSQAREIQIELPYHDRLGQVFNNWRLYRYLYFKYS